MPQPAKEPVTPVEASDLTGKAVGRFVIRARLGAGGMGEVYCADDTRLKRPVALKRVAPRLQADEGYRQRFLREAQYASGLTNQNVAGVYDVLETDGEIFLVMEYVEGQTLRRRLAEPLGFQEFLGIAEQCAAALAAAHERGIVHRDIKPENIMLTPAGQVKILDFGVAKQVPNPDDAATLETLGGGSSSFAGTPAYMAPEVLLEKPSDQRVDIFSLGVVFYEALTGRTPFRGGNFLQTCDRVLHEVPAPLARLNPKVPAELDRIVTKMLAKDPAERYATAADLLVDLRAFEHAGAYPATPLPRALPSKPQVDRGRHGKRWVLLAVLALLLVAVIGFLLPNAWRWSSRQSGARVLVGPKNLAVLPFQAIGGQPENQAYSDGITETLTTHLTQLTATHALQVVPAREVRMRRVSSAEAARKELGVSLVLEGTFDRSGNVVRVNYALVDTGTLRQLRAATITADASNPFAVQDRVAESTVGLLELELKPRERQALETHGTQVAGAYEFYLQGRGYLQNYDKPENVENAVSVFGRALSLDPNYALAHAGLGEAYWKKYEVRKESQWIDSARKACERARALNSKLAAAHICLGTVEDGTGHSEKAVSEFQRALETEPTSDDAYRGLGAAFEHLGQLAQAERTYRQAIELRPHYWAGYNWLGVFYFNQARYPEAAEMFKQVVALAPDSFRGYSNLGAIYVQQGRYREAIPTLERSVAVRPTAGAFSNLATAYFYQRRFADAARTYQEALKLDDRDYRLLGNLADALYWTPGRRAEAAAAYRKAIALAEGKLQVNARSARVLADVGSYHAMLDERQPALARLRRALEIAPDNPDVRFKAALIYIQLGDSDRALGWLEQAAAAGFSTAIIRDTPDFDPLHANPRFQALLRVK
ncbi:MAG: tetratricopeptide repeat protein [Candidatus Acidiferrales bacterium]